MITTAEATERLIAAMLVELGDRDEDELMPMREFLRMVGEVCGRSGDELDEMVGDLPEWETVGWLRARSRAALAGIARGDL